jgi:hypothetical protein
MRKLSPAIIATAVAMAFASTAATAQRIGVATATGTNGSTVTSSTTSPGPSGTAASSATTGSGTSRSNLGLEPRAQVNTGQAGGTSAPSAFGDRAFTTPEDRLAASNSDSSLNTNTTTDVTPNNGNAAPVGSALGTSAGQTSAGTAGAQSAGAGVTGITNPNLGLSGTTVTSAQGTIVNANGTNVGTGVNGANALNGGTLTGNVVVPGVGFAGAGFTGGMGDVSGVNANGERVGSGGADFRAASNVVVAPTPTPIFNQAAARGAARDAVRRARGDEPRIIGLAPRTDRDLTHQMPDDPIIRY